MVAKCLKHIMLPIVIFLAFSPGVFAKKKITIISEDGVSITADLYFKATGLPYVLMFHQDASSRGEFNEIAERIMSLGYNCLAVDLRLGGSANYVDNETADYAKTHGYLANYAETEKDVKTAISYAYKTSGKPLILFGSSFSSTICLKQAINNARIMAVIAFHPGEYLKPTYLLKDNLHDLDKPVFVAGSKSEQQYIKDIFSTADAKEVTLFIPKNDQGEKGANALWSESENNKEYWLALLMFFSKLY